MIAMLVGGAFLAGVFAIGLMLATLGLVLRAVFWLVLLPFKILFGVLSLALLIPIILVSVGLLVAGVLFAVLMPLLPLVLLAAMVWGLVRLFERPAGARA